MEVSSHIPAQLPLVTRWEGHSGRQDGRHQSFRGEGQTGHEIKEKALALVKGGKKKAPVDWWLLELPKNGRHHTDSNVPSGVTKPRHLCSPKHRFGSMLSPLWVSPQGHCHTITPRSHPAPRCRAMPPGPSSPAIPKHMQELKPAQPPPNVHTAVPTSCSLSDIVKPRAMGTVRETQP